MKAVAQRWPFVLAFVACLFGLFFAALSSNDYARHLDRQMHDVHCSYIPGAAPASKDNACRAAMYSPYAALFRDRYWGGVPISLFALGAFSFFAAFALYLALAGARAPRRAPRFFAIMATSPLLVSGLMAFISATKLGQFCKTCTGIYIASASLAIFGWIGVVVDARAERDRRDPGPIPDAAKTSFDEVLPPGLRPDGQLWQVAAWAVALAVASVTPAGLYVSALPSYTTVITACGKLPKPAEPPSTLLHFTPPGAKQPATLFVDPLCPTCKALHKRLSAEGFLDQLDMTLVLFPLDSECNWMLDRPLHPGSCAVTKAILCSEHRAMRVLEWAYDNQDDILAAAKAGGGIPNVRAMIAAAWPGLDTCIDSKETTQRLHRMLRFIIANQLPVSTPQVFIGDTKLCDEDTDMGLSYTMRRLAPALVAR